MLRPGESRFVDLIEWFRDPDGDALTYTFASSDTSIVRLFGFGTSLYIRARPEITGVATVTATATDSDDASVTASIQVEVATSGRTGFQDDFNGDELSRDWLFTSDARIRFEDGLLKVTRNTPGSPAAIVSQELPLLSSAVVSSRLAFGTIENTSLSLYLLGSDPSLRFLSAVRVEILSEARMLDRQMVNYYAHAFYVRAADENPRHLDTWLLGGSSDAVPDSVGEFVELKITTDEDRLRVWIDEEQIFDVELLEWMYPVRSVWLLVGHGGGDSLETGQVGWFDWVDVEGEFNVAAEASPSQSRLGTPRWRSSWVGLFDQIRQGGGTP